MKDTFDTPSTPFIHPSNKTFGGLHKGGLPILTWNVIQLSQANKMESKNNWITFGFCFAGSLRGIKPKVFGIESEILINIRKSTETLLKDSELYSQGIHFEVINTCSFLHFKVVLWYFLSLVVKFWSLVWERYAADLTGYKPYARLTSLPPPPQKKIKNNKNKKKIIKVPPRIFYRNCDICLLSRRVNSQLSWP